MVIRPTASASAVIPNVAHARMVPLPGFVQVVTMIDTSTEQSAL